MTESIAAPAALEQYFDSPVNYAHASAIAELVLERLPSGNYAWLEPEASTDTPEPDDSLYVPTADGYALCACWRAERACFGREVS